MKGNRKAQALTVAVLLAALGIALVKKTDVRLPDLKPLKFVRSAEPSQEPQDAIYAMLTAAREGNVKGYIAAFTGQIETSLRRTLSETTEAGFAKYLRNSNAAIKGVAVSDPQKITDLEAKVRVEYIYQDRNEAQIIYLEKNAGGWKISRTAGDEHVMTLIPYGTPVK